MKIPTAATILGALATLSYAQDTDLTTVVQAFTDSNIPGNISLSFEPTILLEVAFPQDNGTLVNVTAGVQLNRSTVANAPQFSLKNSSADAMYVIAMLDLDAPTPQDPTIAQYRHFLGGDFEIRAPQVDDMISLANVTAAVTEYAQPSPPDGSDPHRYVFLLFNQSDDFVFQTEVNSTTARNNWNVGTFASDVQLGDIVGGTFMLVGPDNDNSTDASNTTSSTDAASATLRF